MLGLFCNRFFDLVQQREYRAARVRQNASDCGRKQNTGNRKIGAIQI
jgi:hypothetical protein